MIESKDYNYLSIYLVCHITQCTTLIIDPCRYIDHIERAYNYASEELLKMLLEEKDLKGRLRYTLLRRYLFIIYSNSALSYSYYSPFRSIRNYFLMNQGDFFVHFMDLAEDEMRKSVEDILTLFV